MRSTVDRLREITGRILEVARQEGLAPGSRLRESRLAERLGVSRGPVRAGLQELERAGLVVQTPGRGFALARPLDDSAARRLLDEGALSETRYLTIASDRLDGILPDVVSEGELMRRYQLTRPELGRLLDRIAGEGWISRLPGYGWRFAASLSGPDAYEKATRLRIMIEPAGLLEPEFRLDPTVASTLRQQQERMLAGDEGFTLSEVFRFGCEFHEGLARGSGNPFLLDTLQRVNSLRRLFAYRSLLPDRKTIQRQSGEHLRLLDMLEHGDRARAASFLTEHLRDAARTVPVPRSHAATDGAARNPERPDR